MAGSPAFNLSCLMVDEWSLPIYSGWRVALHQHIADIQKPFQVWCRCSQELCQWPNAISSLTCSIRRLIGHGTSNSSRDLRPHRCPSGNDPWGWAQHCMSHLCETTVGYLPSAGLQAAEACLDSDQGRCWWNRDWSTWTAGLVNTDADVRSWSSEATKKSRSCCCMHKAARLDDGLGD